MSQPALPTVGVFDSGVGGLSVLRRMLDVARPPWGKVVYLADLAHFPYGPRATEEVRRLGLAGVDLLAARGAGVVVVACNTASSSGVASGTAGLSIPLLDIIGPGAREVAALAASGAGAGDHVIVLGTEGTVRNRVWERALREAGFLGPITGWPCPFLANLIEEGRNGLMARKAVLEVTRGLAASPGLDPRPSGRGPSKPGPAEIVVLGCTHFPFIEKTIEEVLETDVLRRRALTVDPAGALVRELVAWLEKRQSAAEGLPGPADERPPEVTFLTTGRAAHFAERARQLLADRLTGGSNGLRLDEVTEVAFPGPPA